MTMLRDIASYMKSGESPDHNLGLEIEHFIVNEKGNQIGFDEISGLIRDIGNQIGAEIHYIIPIFPISHMTMVQSTKGKHQVFQEADPSFRDFTITATAPSKTFNLAGFQTTLA